MIARPPQSPDLFLPLTLLSRYLYFLGRRPLSASNSHFRTRRIRGLSTLSAFLRDRDDPALEEAAELLLALTASNLFRQGVALQTLLKQRTAEVVPRGIVVSPDAPDAEFWQGVRRVRLIFGPGIGIGDEIICFRIPAACKALMPTAEIDVLSAYGGLWNAVPMVSSTRRYHGDLELVEAIRAAHYLDDVILFADFEPSGLTPAICHEPAIGRFAELSLGTRSLTAYDARRRQVFRMPTVDPCFSNFYACLERMLRWLGAGVDFPGPVLAGSPKPEAKTELRVLVSPFTSKEDPSEGYWSRLLTRMLPGELVRPVRIMIDTGGTPASASFAAALSRSAKSFDHPDLRCETVSCKTGRNAPLDEMLGCIGQADLVVTADSFPAHAAAAFGQFTFVIGRQGVENWHAPSPMSFYLPAEAAVGQVASAIREVIRSSHLGSAATLRQSPRGGHVFRRLRSATELVGAALAAECPWPELVLGWSEFTTIYHEAVSAVESWPHEFALMLSDRPYRQLCGPAPERASDAARTYLADEFSFWTNSNFYKYLRLPPAAPGVPS